MCIQNIFGNFSAVCSYIGKKGMKREKQIKKLTAYLRCRSAKVDIDVFSSRIESNALNQIKIFTALWQGSIRAPVANIFLGLFFSPRREIWIRMYNVKINFKKNLFQFSKDLKLPLPTLCKGKSKKNFFLKIFPL